jgi:hypothetical protein
MYELLIGRKQEEDRQQFIRTGMLCAAIINFGFCRPKELVKVEDFVPGAKKKLDLTKMTPEEQASYVISNFMKTRT